MIGIPAGAQASSWGDPTLECYYDPLQDVVECEGIRCTTFMQLSEGGSRSAASGGVYYCSNGCEIVGFSYYSCPSGGGGEVTPPSGDEGGGGSDEGEQQTCPTDDPLCVRELSQNERARIDSAFAMVDYSTPLCVEALNAFMILFDAGRVFGGNPAIPDGSTHSAEFDPGPPPRIHVDSDFLAAAGLRRLASIVIHEGWHAAGKSHPDKETYPYVTKPFSFMDSCAGITR